MEDCTFSELESTAVHYTWNAQPFAVRRSVFRDVRNIAIRGWANAAGPPGSLIERNLFPRIGAEPGYGGNGPWHAAGVIVGLANSAVVRLNRFVDTAGYAGVILGSDGQTVERNVFVRTMGTLDDGAAVYTNRNASTIRDNIILDTVGDLQFSHEWWPLGHGIWLESLDDFHDSVVTGNTISSNNGHGLFDTLGEWTADASSWATSSGSRIVGANAILLFNDTEATATVPVPAGSWTLPDGGPVGATVSLEPFRSAVLVTADAVPSTPPYLAASGINWRAAEPVATYLGDTGPIFADGFETGATGAWIRP